MEMNHPFLIARGDATPLLQAVDTTFYSVTTGIEFTIKGKGAARTMRPPRFLVTSFRDGMSNTSLFQQTATARVAVAAICNQTIRALPGTATSLAWHANGIQKRFRLCTVVPLSGSQEYGQRASFSITGGMNFGGQSSPASSQSLILEVLAPLFKSAGLDPFLAPSVC
jgi:hypothetical protein